jgi:(S)-2-hydroxyglutarate dehydrogenase
MLDANYDIAVIGGGIVGLSVAMELTLRFPRLRLLLLEKESALAQHQTGHNSGVIHSGVYYKPGSLKARACVQGAAAMIAFCREHGIPHEVCGKVIVATREDEVPRLEELRRRGESNGIAGLALLTPEQLRQIEPRCSGLSALHVPGTATTDFRLVSAKYADLVRSRAGEIRTNSEVTGISRANGDSILETTSGSYASRFLVNCAGLHSDEISRKAGSAPELRIIPFRGEYYELVPERRNLVRALIYPTPDPRFPFLGVHFTRRIHGNVDAGPNAVLALRREGYRRADFSFRDAMDELTYSGFWRMVHKYWQDGLAEFYRSLSRRAFVERLQRMVPEIQESDLQPGDSGVRAQAVRPDGSLVDDFQFVCSRNMLHVCNVPSPAATASIPIGRAVADMAQQNFALPGN